MLLNAKTVKTADDPRSKIVMCYVTCPRYPIVCCYFKYIDMTARAQGEKICENYEGLKKAESLWPDRLG